MAASPELQSLALEYARARARVLALKRQRNRARCAQEMAADTAFCIPYSPPCWADKHLPVEEWCDVCQHNREVHRNVLAANRRAVSLWAQLSRLLARSPA